MSAPFKVGEVVIAQNSVRHPELDGMEGVIVVAGTLPHYGLSGQVVTDIFGYGVDWANGEKTFSMPHQLRRRKPPAADSNERMYMLKWRDMADKAPQRVGETV